MKRQPRILAGTAIGLLMASAPLGAYPFSGDRSELSGRTVPFQLSQLQLAQAECEGENCPPEEQQQAPAEEPAPAPEPQPETVPDPAPEPEAVPPEPAPAPEPEPQPQAAPEPAPEPQPEPPPAAEEPAPQVEPAPQPVPEAAPEPAPAEQQAPAEQPPAEQQPAEEPAQQAPGEQTPAEQAPTQQPQEQQPASPDASQPAQEPAEAQPAAPGEQPAPSVPETTAQPTDPNEAPLFDSQKEEAPAQQSGAEQGQQGQQAAQPPVVDPGPPPESDAAATEAAQPQRIEAVTQERGKRRERPPEENLRREQRPEGVDVLREIGDRLILQLGGQTIVESNDRPRMTRGARDVYYEDLPRGRTRETIIRDNGVQIITIRDRYGDVIRRSRITPDGREYVLVYVDEDNYDRVGEWRDPGYDLPPLRVNIPRREYILESEYVDGPDDYYDFLEQPPVERVQRLYSVDEVKRSARVRDIARRIDLDTLTFEFGSASIPESEIQRLEGVASAMERLLERNPAETFLIEGHTDAVGSDVANLALSDRRAEAVAEALTNVFGIPPENLAPQGYGERYLKVKTQAPERENRRVAIRRITPLVAPVASAN
ncbi:OmpA family protein [Mesorhizobium sp. VNQ89]|uniref:OmpA family protein n=1 Tax=Mesorhizobium quangtriensis TaxID=3157709 RepID=UPI0032B837FF